MSFEFYRILHLSGVMLVFLAFGGLAMHGLRGETRDQNPFHRRAAIVHGLGMFCLLLGGFGLLAKGGHGWPVWLYAKLAVWLIFGGAIAVYGRKPKASTGMTIALFALGITAALIGVYQPSL